MLLPRGVTGMSGRREGPPSTTDYRAFRGRCYDVARQSGGSVRHVLAPRSVMACNYGLAVIGLGSADVAVVLNGVYPLLAFAAPPAEGQVMLDFADCPALAAEFERLGGYTLLPAADLMRPLTREMCQELAPHEQKQVGYFRPPRVGDVVFNYWD